MKYMPEVLYTQLRERINKLRGIGNDLSSKIDSSQNNFARNSLTLEAQKCYSKADGMCEALNALDNATAIHEENLANTNSHT